MPDTDNNKKTNYYEMRVMFTRIEENAGYYKHEGDIEEARAALSERLNADIGEGKWHLVDFKPVDKGLAELFQQQEALLETEAQEVQIDKPKLLH